MPLSPNILNLVRLVLARQGPTTCFDPQSFAQNVFSSSLGPGELDFSKMPFFGGWNLIYKLPMHAKACESVRKHAKTQIFKELLWTGSRVFDVHVLRLLNKYQTDAGMSDLKRRFDKYKRRENDDGRTFVALKV